MKITTWNVNGVRSVLNKGALQAYLEQARPDVLCLQETKAQEEQVDFDFETYGYQYRYWNSAEKKGYSGTAILSKVEPLSISFGIGIAEHDREGRVITAEYDQYYVVTVYTPNAKNDLSRLVYRQRWEDAFLSYIEQLQAQKPVIFCGDLNVAHQEIDLANPKSNRGNAGFTDEERAKFSQLMAHQFVDVYRHFYPEQLGVYTWWSYRSQARARNIGWRIDYFIASPVLVPTLEAISIRADVQGSDHCPLELVVKG